MCVSKSQVSTSKYEFISGGVRLKSLTYTDYTEVISQTKLVALFHCGHFISALIEMGSDNKNVREASFFFSEKGQRNNYHMFFLSKYQVPTQVYIVLHSLQAYIVYSAVTRIRMG
jgi:hypothetical protein